MIDLRQLRQVLALAEHRNFVRAAESLHLTQPALTKTIKNLEAELGVALFNRTSKGITPTIFGEKIIEKGRGILIDANNLVQEIQQMKNVDSGSVNVRIAPALEPVMLEKLVCRMSERHPGLDVHFTTSYWQPCAAALKEGTTDLYVGGTYSSSDEFEFNHLFHYVTWFYCKTTHPILNKPDRDITIEDVLQYKAIMLNIPQDIVDTVFELPHDKSNLDPIREAHKVETCDNASVIDSLVSNSNYIGISTLAPLEPLLTSGKVVPFMKASPRLLLNFGITTAKNRSLSPAAQALIHCATELFQEMNVQELALRQKYGVSIPSDDMPMKFK